MITGDDVRTAEAIARQLNIGGDAPRVMTGPEVAALSRRELAACVADVDVFAPCDTARKDAHRRSVAKKW